MTGKLDKQMRLAAQRLVDDFGKPVTIRRTTSTYDVQLGKTYTSTTDYNVNGALENYADRRIDGSLILSGDLQVTIPARDLAITPDQETDALILDSETWSIVNLSRIYSGEQVAVYQMQVRQ